MAKHYSRMSDTAASLTILEDILPGAVNLVGTPVSDPENLHATCNIWNTLWSSLAPLWTGVF